MAEYIEREAAIANRREYNLGGSYDNTELAVPVDAINSIPAADVRPVVRGKWRQIGPKEAVCSVCNNVTLTNGIDRTGHANIHKALYHFCPNCGADMRPTSMSGANGEES